MQFEKPPLVELVAEVKWLSVPSGSPPQNIQPVNPTSTQPMFATSDQEEFFAAFTRESARSGWTASERMFPSGLPLLSYQPALRVRSLQEKETQMIYQVGPGLFSAHALPPYKNWESFRPFVERGLAYLIQSRPKGERGMEFFSVSLRYLDVFTPELVGDVQLGAFLTDILGFSLQLPGVLTAQLRQGTEAEPTLGLLLPLQSGLEMRLNIGRGIMGDKSGIIVDTGVSTSRGIGPTSGEVFAVWEEAHTAIRRTFVGLTGKLHAAMIPIEET
jgi:uncharacterized protein (TIGR04255 family)